MKQLTVTEAVAAADKNADVHAHVILDQKLKLSQSSATPSNERLTSSPSKLSDMYVIIKGDRAAIRKASRRMTPGGRADVLVASRNQLEGVINQTSELSASDKQILIRDVHMIHCIPFGNEMEVPTFQCFYQFTKNSLFFDQHADMVFLYPSTSIQEKKRRQKHLKLFTTFPDLDLRLQGQMDMRDGDKMFEVKNRMWAPEDMDDKYRWAAHAQILVSANT